VTLVLTSLIIYIDATWQAIQARERLLQRLSATSEILRGSLVERVTHHSSGRLKCASG
jgi:hypothetical protein